MQNCWCSSRPVGGSRCWAWQFPCVMKRVRVRGRIGAFVDITERERAEKEKLEMERRLLHAQKLESLGVLAGGIAHDFNNILAGIMGYADLAQLRLPASEPVRDGHRGDQEGHQRAADLTRQMLAYSGKGRFIVEPVDLSRLVEDSQKMLAMSVSKKATVSYNLAADLPPIQADASQMCQVLMNLVINASEALGEQGGAIAVSTSALRCEAKDLAGKGLGQDLPEGRYVCLQVADTGCGMDEQTLAKIFDPFFTTKFTGRGLGLAAVHGIVRGHKGAIQVSSEPGKGTTFRVLFPANGPAAPATRNESAATPGRSSGTVLVVDDEEMVRILAQRDDRACRIFRPDGQRRTRGHPAVPGTSARGGLRAPGPDHARPGRRGDLPRVAPHPPGRPRDPRQRL